MENASKDEQIGFHKGSLSTLAKERQELTKIVNIVEQLMQMHINALKELGVNLEEEAKKLGDKGKTGEPKGTTKPIDDLLN